MTSLFLTIFLASLTGSLHCAGMCGAFVAFAVGLDSDDKRSRIPLHVAYNGGRLVTYAILGAVAGAFGAGLDRVSESLLGVQRIALLIAGGSMILFGLAALARIKGIRVPHPHPPRFAARILERGHRFAVRRPPAIRALIIGLMTTFLPCGWLYAFVIVAAGTGNPLYGALAMAAFWLGTLPVLVAVGTSISTLGGRIARHVPALVAVAITAAGVFTVSQRAAIGPVALNSARAATGTDPSAAVERIDQSELPCCHGAE